MKDASVLLWSNDRLISKLIKYFTGSDITHAAVVLQDQTYESDLGGAKVTRGVRDSDITLEPVRDLTKRELAQMQRYVSESLHRRWPYNILKLVILALVYPTRWFWRKINWVPFDHEVYGETCSSYVDEAFKAAGIDLLPLHHEGS